MVRVIDSEFGGGNASQGLTTDADTVDEEAKETACGSFRATRWIVGNSGRLVVLAVTEDGNEAVPSVNTMGMVAGARKADGNPTVGEVVTEAADEGMTDSKAADRGVTGTVKADAMRSGATWAGEVCKATISTVTGWSPPTSDETDKADGR